MRWLTLGAFFKRFAFLSCSSCEMELVELEAETIDELVAVLSKEAVGEVELVERGMHFRDIMVQLEIHVVRMKTR